MGAAGKDSPLNPEIAIIGASAAGLHTAHLLASGGLRVTVFERAEGLGPTPRTLIVTSRLREILGPLAEEAVVNEIRRFELFANGKVTTVHLKRPDLVIERSALIRLLAKQAERSGARTLPGHRLVHLSPNGKGLTLGMRRSGKSRVEEARAGIVVGADGAFSRVASAAGWSEQVTVPLMQATVELPRGMPPDTTRVWFVPEDTPYFYWLIPESPERGALGLIGEGGKHTRRCLERFLRKRGLEAIEFQAGRIPLYTRWVPIHRRIGGGDVYLVGDAAGQVKVTTVGGIVTGFRGAQAVADAALNGRSRRELRSLRRELDLHLLVRKTVHRFREEDYSRLFDLLDGSAREALSVHTRDEMPRLLWDLLRRQPRLLLPGLRQLPHETGALLPGWIASLLRLVLRGR